MRYLPQPLALWAIGLLVVSACGASQSKRTEPNRGTQGAQFSPVSSAPNTSPGADSSTAASGGATEGAGSKGDPPSAAGPLPSNLPASLPANVNPEEAPAPSPSSAQTAPVPSAPSSSEQPFGLKLDSETAAESVRTQLTGRTVEEVQALIGAPTRVENGSLIYRLPKGCAFEKWVFRLKLADGRVSQVAKKKEFVGRQCP